MRKILLLLLLLLATSSLAEPPAYLHIVSDKQIGPVKKSSTWQSIINTVGSAYVEEGEVYVGEGVSVPATIVYPGHPNRTLKVIWKEGPRSSATPDSVWLSGSDTEWTTPDRITLGTGLSRLEKVNGGPFKLHGFEWDFGGLVTRWNGKLENRFKGMSVRLALPPKGDFEEPDFEAMSGILGDVEIGSDHPYFLGVDPVIDQIVVSF